MLKPLSACDAAMATARHNANTGISGVGEQEGSAKSDTRTSLQMELRAQLASWAMTQYADSFIAEGFDSLQVLAW